MRFLYPHRFWLAVLACAVLLVAASNPLLQVLREKTSRYLSEVRTERMRAEEIVRQIDGDRETANALSGEMNEAELEKALAPIDRLRAAAVLERQAAVARLSRFTYTLSPEQKVTVTAPGAGPQELALSTITMSAEAPLDTSAYVFVEQLRQTLPGRIRPQQVMLERLDDAAPLSASNLRLTATLEWLSNGVTKEMAAGR
ncbi:MAG: hypothetical protein SFW62_00865 [Alphaproteobacteria bacterium]|nr:hypothetical protein [Alphaproteobacteria bacterium]